MQKSSECCDFCCRSPNSVLEGILLRRCVSFCAPHTPFGCSFYSLAIEQPESSHWIFSVIRALIGLLDSPSISSCTCQAVLEQIISVIGHLEDEQQLLSTISSLLPAIRLIQGRWCVNLRALL
jgi:hypothetical protein